ncbi:MAG TPA: galactose oxidase-like domain-containing protein [Miltoncostaea sp.]|nr:galactose oxidase-like domain-containing protein [Miltoncostaea sp.]
MVGAALLAALIVAAPIVVAARGVRPPSSLAAAEPSAWSAAHAHADTAKNLAADRAQARRCTRAAYRRHHPARCPAPQARPGTQRATDGGDPASTGRWAAPFAVPTWAIHAVLLPTGKVLWLSKRQDETAGGDAHLYDPATGTVKAVTPPSVRYPDGSVKPANLFCAGQALLPDGRVLVAGGNLAYYQSDAPGQSWKGAKWLFTFDPWTETWTRQSTDMAKGRWYPTVTALPDGRALITGGWDESGNDVSDDDMEVFTPSPRVNGADGTVTKVGTRPWSQLYPHMFVIPDTTAAGAGSAKVLMAGPMGRYPANAGILDTATWQWTSIPYLPTNREFGGAVMMPGGNGGPTKVLLTGGSDAPFDTTPTASTAVLDLNAPNAGFQPGPPLLTARTHGNVVALPDGSVMEVGGGGGTSDPTDGSIYDAPVYRSELLDPGAGAFRAADAQSEARTYHATALLLPDGRVLSAGDDRASHATNRTAELYSPPYLFRGARPRITFAPSAARYDVRIRVGTPDPGAIARAVLMRPSSVTHVTDMDARSMTLALTAENGGLTLRTPRDGTVAPPGWYMLFLLDRNGVPSVASWIRLDPSAPDAPEIPGAGGGGAPVPDGTVSGSGGGDRTTTATPGRTRDRVAPRVTLAVGAPTHAANGTLTAVIRVRTGERAGLRVRVALGRRVVERTLRAAPGAWAAATVHFGHAPLHAFLHVKVRAADAAGNARTAVRTVRF